ncbi:MAG: hypothetical protein VB086_11480 [Clostridiaceae bacterium]|nr:hypothetical protein [Clostridiaceae bacterium]
MKRKLTTKQLILLMIALSAAIYTLHYIIFRDFHHIAIFFFHELAFLPLEVVLVTLVFEKLLERSRADENRGKISMIESVFFSESGCDLLLYLRSCDPDSDLLKEHLALDSSWKQKDFLNVRTFLKNYPFHVDPNRLDFYGIHYHLSTRHSYFLKVIENPALMEHEDFTDLILRIYLLWEELDGHDDLYSLPEDVRVRLCALVDEVYVLLTNEWLDNARNIQLHQPIRLNKIIQTNPFLR